MDMFICAGMAGYWPCTRVSLTLMAIYGDAGATPFAGKLLDDFMHQVCHQLVQHAL